jgi:hypothetical protein
MKFVKNGHLKKIFFMFLFLIGKLLFAAPQQLQIVGAHTQTLGGCNFRLTGVNTSGLEYSSGGFGAPSGFGGDIKQSITGAVNTWKANIIRIPLSQDYWFGNGGANQATYRAIVDGAIATATSLNCYVELDLQWSGTGSWGTATALKSMPDSNSRAFWQDVAARYANNPTVIFDLFNEPYTTSWAIWKNGGTTSEGFSTPGFQQLVKDVRDTGAKNIISVGGLGYSWNMTGIAANALTDTNTGNTLTGYGIMYEAHIYDNKGGTTEASKIALWNSNVTVAVTAGFCVMMGEFGPGSGQDASGCTPFETDLLSWINGTNTANYVYNAMAWNFSTEAAPCLLSSWSGFTATACHGTQVKNWLAAITAPNCGNSTPVNTPVTTNTNTQTYTRTRTQTSTRTLTPTFTFTFTPTYTRTATPTYTVTNTSVPSTATFTRTSTFLPTPSFTASATQTATQIRTATGTPAPSSTSTPANSATNTVVTTATETATGPPTATFTMVNTATKTPANTATQTSTVNPVLTATFTYTNTLIVTATDTPTGPQSATYTQTLTRTATVTSTRTATLLLSATVTVTLTRTPTLLLSATVTVTLTRAATLLPSVTLTLTRAATSTPTHTATILPSVTATITPQGNPAILEAVIYPNPVGAGQDLNIQVKISGCPAEMTLRIYTASFRRVIEQTWKSGLSYPSMLLTVPAAYLGRLSNGTYYYVLFMKDCAGLRVVSKRGTFIVLK